MIMNFQCEAQQTFHRSIALNCRIPCHFEAGALKELDTWIRSYPFYALFCLNPLSPNSDQHQFSPNDIHTLSRD